MAIADCGLRISDRVPRRARLLLTLSFFLFPFSFFAACASVPVYPDPTPGEGQILVELKGIPRDGVKGPVRETVRDDYSSHSESVEKGKAFERVKYDQLEDVLTLLTRADGEDVYAIHFTFGTDDGTTLTLTRDGFTSDGKLRRQVPLNLCGWFWLYLNNDLDVPVEFYLEHENGGLTAITVPAKSTHKGRLPPGVHDLTCDQVGSAGCRVVATSGGALSYYTHDAEVSELGRYVNGFFNDLRPSEYDIVVYPPRLPEVRKRVTVEAGKRTTVIAELTVNHLPKAVR